MAKSSGKAPEAADKYANTPPAYLIPNFQQEWSDLAAKVFNIDVLDILLTSEEKSKALALIAIPITSSSFGNKSRAQALHRTVSQAREMGQSKRPPCRVTIIAALLIYMLEPPLTWWEWTNMHQPLGILRYVRDCADGLSIYSSEGMLKAALAHSPGGPTGDHPDNLFVVDKPQLEETSVKPAEATPLNSDHPTLAALRPWTRSITKLTTPSPPSKKRKVESDFPPGKKDVQKKEMSSPKKIKLTVPKKKVVSPKKKSATPKKVMAESGTKPTPQAKYPKTRDPEAVKRQQPIDNALLARYMKSAPMLDRIADYNDGSVRRVALASFLEDLKSSGWEDLEKCTWQLIKDDDYESRAFLAEAIMNDVYKRINDSVEGIPQPAQLTEPARPEHVTHQPVQQPTEAKQTAQPSLDEQPMDTPTKRRSRSRPKQGKKSTQTKKRTPETKKPATNTSDEHNTPTKQASRPFRFSPSSGMSDDVFNDSPLSAASPAAGRRHLNLASPPRFNIRGILSKRLKSKDSPI
ncbi:hypothetical protein JMJ77_0011947 [Colletotrichum scovillei]|uniref:Uncharacterized protein n=1 Tax=Colletotrichum scovillei TaxID=1209932 RepID=A0A9P7QY42_9PEZI|nr:hypothetical protein JMJ77_0011947 [Colletotrichum scovillei]KAG7046231.1 hypothetical protein JMJ78_0011297 [Colletotrichum scovillei]KAG7063580.1 hypothetical protein JMJ76_0006042 [Colletotrichum scovillei]